MSSISLTSAQHAILEYAEGRVEWFPPNVNMSIRAAAYYISTMITKRQLIQSVRRHSDHSQHGKAGVSDHCE